MEAGGPPEGAVPDRSNRRNDASAGKQANAERYDAQQDAYG
jgi:hypothetical protein